jgi:hypothetical protein
MDRACPTAPSASSARKPLRASGSTATSLIIWTRDSGSGGVKVNARPPLMAAAALSSRCATALMSAPGRSATVAAWNLKV